MQLIWNSNFPLIFFGGGVIVFAIYAVMKWRVSENFFHWRCYQRLGALELMHILVLGGVYYAIFSDPSNWRHVVSVEWGIGLISLGVHAGVMIGAHSWARAVGRVQARSAGRRRPVNRRAEV